MYDVGKVSYAIGTLYYDCTSTYELLYVELMKIILTVYSARAALGFPFPQKTVSSVKTVEPCQIEVIYGVSDQSSRSVISNRTRPPATPRGIPNPDPIVTHAALKLLVPSATSVSKH